MGSAKEDIEKALVFLRQGRTNAAVPIIRKALKKEPKNPDALHLFGVCHYMAGRTKPAIMWLNKAAVEDPNNADIENRLGLAYRANGQNDKAAEAYDRAITLNPNLVDARNNLGNLLLSGGQFGEALNQYRIALDLNPEFIDAHHNMGIALLKDGRAAEALEALKATLDLSPDHSSAWASMGTAQKDLGNSGEAEAYYRKALELDPNDLGTWFNLHAVLYDDGNPEPACQCLERALRIDPRNAKVHFFLGVARARQGRKEESERHLDIVSEIEGAPGYRLDSWNYIAQTCGENTKFLGTSAEVLRMAIKMAKNEGMVLEFGVRHGTSIRLIADEADQQVHGFDTFEGLPEDWHEERAGSYSTRGALPQVPDNVDLHKGLFEDTLPAFLERQSGMVRLVNVDCDLYSSTRTVFEHLGERVTHGTVIVFDEYLCHPHWREDEFKAFQEAALSHGWAYDYIAFSLFTKQAVVLIR